jgi:energy-coupling factor transporter ATP-binding protein EcfA2
MEGKDYVLPEFFNLDPNIGGHQSLLIGNSGQGKTTLMEYFTMLAVSGKNIYNKNREKQAALWRARKHDRYLDFVNLKIGRLMFPRNSSFLLQKIWPKEDGGSVQTITMNDLEEEGIDYGFFDDASDLVKKMEPGIVSIIMWPLGKSLEDRIKETEFYGDLFAALNNRTDENWIHVAIDEAGDILTANMKGSFLTNLHLVLEVSDFRKNNINSIFGTHRASDLDYRVLGKLPYHIYKMGATKIDGDARKVSQNRINSLRKEQAVIIEGAFWDDFTYPDVPHQEKIKYRLQTTSQTFTVEKVDDVQFNTKKGRKNDK